MYIEYDFNQHLITKTKNSITIYEYEIQSVVHSYGFLRIPTFYELPLHLSLLFIIPTTLFVSFISLVFASVDRHIALTFPFGYRGLK